MYLVIESCTVQSCACGRTSHLCLVLMAKGIVICVSHKIDSCSHLNLKFLEPPKLESYHETLFHLGMINVSL